MLNKKKGPLAIGLSSAMCLGLGFAAPASANPPPNGERPGQTTENTDPHFNSDKAKEKRTKTALEKRDSAGSSKGSFARLGSDQAKEIQRALKNEGHYDGKIDGIVGPKTRQALRAYQQSEDVMVSGRIDSQTASLLGVDIRTNNSNEIQRVSGSQAPAAERRAGTAARATGDRSLREIQQKLRNEGYYEQGTIDGIMGPKTSAALKKYQQENGLKATGQVDAQTREKLGVSTTSASDQELLDFEDTPDATDAPMNDRPMGEPMNRRDMRSGERTDNRSGERIDDNLRSNDRNAQGRDVGAGDRR